MTIPIDKTAALHPLQPPRNLTKALIDRLTADIVGGALAPGERLPTEQQMVAALGVSRTVVREAVAALKADGLVTTRQGVGAFVSLDAARRPFKLDPDALGSIDDVVNVLELRAGVECEAAGLAAERAGKGGLRAIDQALKALDGAIAKGASAVPEDQAFHRAIANAAGNPQFGRFLEFLGRFMIPRQMVRGDGAPDADRAGYMAVIQTEHVAIRDAIAAGDGEAARRAMRRHLENSRNRYRDLAQAWRARDADGAAPKGGTTPWTRDQSAPV